MRLLNNETWTCHFCGEERPDARIWVMKADITRPGYGWPPWTMSENRRFCNDRTVCILAASAWKTEAERKAREENNGDAAEKA